MHDASVQDIVDNIQCCLRRMRRLQYCWSSLSNLGIRKAWNGASSLRMWCSEYWMCCRWKQAMFHQYQKSLLLSSDFFWYHGNYSTSCYYLFLVLVSNHSGGSWRRLRAVPCIVLWHVCSKSKSNACSCGWSFVGFRLRSAYYIILVQSTAGSRLGQD